MVNIAGGTVEWDVKLNLNQFQQGLSGVKSQMADLGKNLDKTNSSFKLQGGILDSVGKKLIALAAGYVGFRAVSGIIQSSIDKFNQYEKAVTNLTTVILNQKDATQENVKALMSQAEAYSNVSVFSQEQIMTAQSVIAQFDGMTTELTMKAIPAWVNYTALQHQSINTTEDAKAAAESFGKALVGSTQALTNQGFKFTDAQREILKTGDVTKRMAVVVEAMTYATDAAANQAQTLEGRMKILNNQFDNSRLAIGGVAQMVKVELLNAFLQSTSNGETWGDNMLNIAKQVGTAFVKMANVAGQAIIGLLALANKTAVGIQGVKALQLGAEAGVASKIEGGGIFGKALGWLRGPGGRSSKEINKEIVNVGESVLSLDEDQRKLGESSLNLEAALGKVEGKITGLKSVSDLMAISAKQTGSGIRDMGKEGAASAEDVKKAQEKLATATEKVIDFRQKEIESSNKVKEALEKQKIKLAELKVEYEKAVAAIKRSLEELDKNFDKSEKSAQESFMSGLASAAETAKQTIADRNAAIQTEMNQATPDQAKISELQGLNARDQAILDANAEQIGKALQIQADKKTALGVQQVIDQYNQERNERLAQYEQDKADLQQQLSDKQAEYEKNSAAIKTDTVKAIADIKAAYIKMFDDLQRELAKLGDSFLNLMKLGAIAAPGPSKEAEAAFAAITKNIPKRAFGGSVSSDRPYLVGERGPEIVSFGRSGNISPSMGGVFNFYVSEKIDLPYVLDQVKKNLGMSGLHAAAGISS